MGAEVHVCPAHVAADDPDHITKLPNVFIKRPLTQYISINISIN